MWVILTLTSRVIFCFHLTKSINIKPDLLFYLRALITVFKNCLIWHYDSTCHKCLPSFVKLGFADKHSILSITNDSYPLPKVIFIFYPYEQVKLQIYLQHIYSQFFLYGVFNILMLSANNCCQHTKSQVVKFFIPKPMKAKSLWTLLS